MLARVATITLLLAGAVGCSWLSPNSAPHFTEATELTAPWNALMLPVGDAMVTFSDAETLSVHHHNAEPAELGKVYGASLVAAGWALDADTSAGEVVNQTYVKAGESLALSVMTSRGDQVVSLSLLPF